MHILEKNIRSFLFLLNTSFIFASELFIYTIFRDYDKLIDNLTKRLASINILYVKIFQAIALNNSLIDNQINNKLLKFTDNAPWNYSDINITYLVEMVKKYNIYLPYGYDYPINAGMISLVFKGVDRNNANKQIIIKMKRKNIHEKLDNAIDNLLFLVYLLSFLPIINKYQIADVVNKNIEIIRQQTNFFQEIENMEKIRHNCKHLKYVKIPEVNMQATEDFPDIILMEYIEGMKINQLFHEDYESFAEVVIKFGLVSTLIHGATHGDLHAGNILFIKDKTDTKYPHKIGIIDFGIIYEVGTQYKEFLFDIFTQMFKNTPCESAEKILNSGIIEPPGILQQIPKRDYNKILNFTEEIVSDTINSSKKANQIQLYKFILNLKEYFSKDELCNIGIRPSNDLLKSQLVLGMSHGITLMLCKEDFITLMDKVINELFHTDLLLN